MINQITSLQRSVPSPRRSHRHAWSNRCANSLRLYDRAVDSRQTSSFPLLEADGKPPRILVVDDVNTTEPLVYNLHTLGYWATRAASSGEATLQLARDFQPAMVLLALELPDMSAYQVATQLHDQAAGGVLRIIALTNDYAHTGRELARQAGFERYLAKPVSVSALHQLLHMQQP
jgi:CheY-like chemotaxis protein